jgi:hypothetical protein
MLKTNTSMPEVFGLPVDGQHSMDMNSLDQNLAGNIDISQTDILPTVLEDLQIVLSRDHDGRVERLPSAWLISHPSYQDQSEPRENLWAGRYNHLPIILSNPDTFTFPS